MATITHIPNPASVNVRTAGYTIPADRYARAVANVIGSATFTINGVTALAGTQNSVLASDNLRLSSVDGSTPGGLYSGVSANSIQGVGGAFSEATQQQNLVQDYFLPPGTIINGTGTWRAVVEEYFN